MLGYKKTVFSALLALGFLVGCGGNNDDIAEFNKPASYWYGQIVESITSNTMDKADAYYISLKSEHARSPFMPTAIMMLAHAHMQNEKYLLSTYYLEEYSKRFGQSNEREMIEFMKLKASFLGIKDVYKDQKLVIDSIAKAKTYLYRYPGSEYMALVNTILIRLQMSQYLLNENIAALYDRIDKPSAATLYREKNNDSIVKMKDITPPKQGIIGKIFD